MLTDLFTAPAAAVDDARRILLETAQRFNPSHIFGMFSGGNDSICACHVARAVFGTRFTAAVHINTQTGIDETREHVGRVAAAQGWPLLEYFPPTPSWALAGETAYEACVRRWGFPGPAGHNVIYTRLKERCVRQLVREHKQHAGDRIMLVGGMRLSESTRRMGNASEFSKEGCRVWAAPILQWENWNKGEYMQAHGLPRNPVTEKLGISGECMCGSFACPGEYERTARHYPKKAEQIRGWEAMAASHGVHCVWGERPPTTKPADAGQSVMFGLCWSCGAKADRRSA